MSLELDIADDFRSVVDWLKPAIVAGQSVKKVLRRAIRTKEAEASAGKYTTSDVAFHVDVREFAKPILVGDTITDGEGKWTVLEAHKETLANRWRCVCRLLRIVGGSIVTIQKASYIKSPTGSQEPMWETVAENVRAKFQIVSASTNHKNDNRHTMQLAKVFFSEQRTLSPVHRIVGEDGTVLKVQRWAGFDSIDQLFMAECEISKWPQS